MGRPQDEVSTSASAPRTQGFGDRTELWLHIPPTTQTLVVVPGLGQAAGEEITTLQRADLQRHGWCEEVAYYAGSDQYWKMPSHGSIMSMPKHYGIPMPQANRVKIISKLVKPDQAKGFWLHVRLRSEEELALES